jgi:AMP nucleosidase
MTKKRKTPTVGSDLNEIDEYSRDRAGTDTLERFTGSKISDFQPYILLTNFTQYVESFSEKFKAPISRGSGMIVCHSKKNRITMIDCHIGSPMAALTIDLLSFIKPKAVLSLGLCGGLRPEHKIGDFFVPIAAIREEGTSDAYMPIRCPSLSSFVIQRFVSEELEKRKLIYFNGVIHTTNVRFWEYNEEFKEKLAEERAQAIDMECATLFTVGFARYVPVGALMLISDLPLQSKGIKDKKFNEIITKSALVHLEMGISILKKMQRDANKKGLAYHF